VSLLGIDLGTTGCKAVAFDMAGRPLASAYHEYQMASPEPGCYELDADLVWRAVAGVIQTVNRSPALTGAPVTALCLSVSGDEFVLVDEPGRCLHPVLMSMDNRGQAEADWLSERLGRMAIYARTGLPVHRKYGLARMLWYRRHQPELWARAVRCLTWEEFIHLRLGAPPVSDHSSLARLMTLDIATRRPALDLLEAAGVEAERIAEAVPSGTPIGQVAGDIARALGFSAPVTLVAGGFDQSMACLGAGITEPGEAMVGTGTMEALCVVAREPALSPALLKGGYPWNIHPAPDRVTCTATNVGGGLVLRWFRDTFGEAAVRAAAASGRDAYDLLLAEAPPEPTDLLLLPHLAGSGPPYKDADSLGAITGLRAGTTRGEILRAVLEGVTYELRQNLEQLAASGVSVTQLRAVGGGARSALWAQIKADVTGLPVVRPRVEEAGCLAAAMLSGVALGVWPTVAEAAAHLVTIQDRFQPDPGRHEAYTARFELYRQLYPALRQIHHGLSGLASGR
jgi:xylulokinase